MLHSYDDYDEYDYDDDTDDECSHDEPPPKRRKGGCLNRLIFFAALILCIAGTYLGCKGYEMYSRAVSILPVEEMISQLRENEHYTYINDIPVQYREAVVAVEDRRFYLHHGIDPISLGRAVIQDIKSRSFAEGGSTITQQLAKNIYFSQEKTLVRQAAEVFAAFDIEKNYSKDLILEMYMNSVYYGDNCYCIYDASMDYFGCAPADMDLYQCMLLAGVPNAPSAYSPKVSPELAEQRRKQVAEAMVAAGYITQSEADAATTDS